MVNEKLLDEKIKASGKKKGYLAGKCELSRQGFRNCELNKAEFKPSQIAILCYELGIKTMREKEQIFFALSDSQNESK